MFNPDFYPTALPTIEELTYGLDITGKIILEPQAGSGHIVDYCLENGAKEVIACENDQRLKHIVKTKCKLIAEDFLTVTSDQVSHIDYIIMNPPFSNGVQHLLHAYSIAPAGCEIRSLLNYSNLINLRIGNRKELMSIIESYGSYKNLGECFSEADRKTNVQVAMVCITKPGENYNTEFEGFFLEEDENEIQENGIMSYNAVRDIVNRYVSAIKLYDQQLELAVQMNSLTHEVFFKGQPEISMTVSRNTVPIARNDFKKSMQRAGWNWIFEKMNLQKYATRGLKEDINKFVEKQTEIPFTMKNIYHMLDIVVGTTSQRMNKALLEVFDKITLHHDENRFNVEGWKTNSHYLVGKKFILPNICYQDQRWYKGQSKMEMSSSNETVEDFVKALCYITGDDFNKFGTLYSFVRYRWKVVTEKQCFHYNDYNSNYHSVATKRKELYETGIASEIIDCEPVYGEWFEWAYFRCKGFKKGSMHFEFKDEELWGKFNQRIAEIKGFPLFEGKKQTKYQEKQTGRATQKKANPAHQFKPNVLFEVNF